ncbi:RHS repeat-associated core domain-containing protein [Flavisolibacter nicotianae]|uniref:RHS repeat-associated core domain-containing protein n=1 Tax=Flavisolibacter nicotianae TaxID=2364882 RepID=UPI000EB34594|nr:RHS repeat-associated core domain-containing protein [Flavisolibacter nicotianae]
MKLPGRSGALSASGLWQDGGSSTALPANPVYNSRSGNQPLEYRATESISFVEGFESGVNDAFEAYITTDNGSGSGGNGGSAAGLYADGGYRYGFNGKENDNEVKGEGNQQDYGMRIYDPRLGRFLSVDPVVSEFPWISPYAFAENDVIRNFDLDGLEKATPAVYDMAVQLREMVGRRVTNSTVSLSKTTDKEVIKTLKLSIELDKRTYAALVLFTYKNHPTETERLAYYAEKAKPIVKEGLDLTPAGDVKVVLTGKNFRGEESSRLGAVGWLALDVFGAEILSGLGKAGRAARVLEGAGKEALENVIKKVNNISTALDELHIRAAVNDIFGKPVIINGKAYDHLTEVKNALGGLKNQIKELNKLINSNKVSRDVVETATELRNTLSKQKDEINAVLDRATKAAKNK